MNQQPKFTAAIQEAARIDAQRAAAAAAAAEAQEHTRQRLAASALEHLTHIVLPLLEQALRDLAQAGIVAEIGNGRDAYGYLRYSLRILAGHTYPPALVFTATHNGLRPHLGHHSEFYASALDYHPQEIKEVTEESITAIISTFLATPKLPQPG